MTSDYRKNYHLFLFINSPSIQKQEISLNTTYSFELELSSKFLSKMWIRSNCLGSNNINKCKAIGNKEIRQIESEQDGIITREMRN